MESKNNYYKYGLIGLVIASLSAYPLGKEAGTLEIVLCYLISWFLTLATKKE